MCNWYQLVVNSTVLNGENSMLTTILLNNIVVENAFWAEQSLLNFKNTCEWRCCYNEVSIWTNFILDLTAVCLLAKWYLVNVELNIMWFQKKFDIYWSCKTKICLMLLVIYFVNIKIHQLFLSFYFSGCMLLWLKIFKIFIL